MPPAVVAGSTGLIGRALVAQLAKEKAHDEVVALTRRAIDAPAPNVRPLVVDFGRLDEVPLPEGADTFCALGTTIRAAGSQEAFRRVDHDHVMAFAHAMASRGARSLMVVSALGADASSRVFYNRVKGEMEEALRDVAIPSITVVRPSLLLGKRNELRPAERAATAAARLLDPIMKGTLRKYRAIPADKVAAAMVRAATEARPGFHALDSDALWD